MEKKADPISAVVVVAASDLPLVELEQVDVGAVWCMAGHWCVLLLWGQPSLLLLSHAVLALSACPCV